MEIPCSYAPRSRSWQANHWLFMVSSLAFAQVFLSTIFGMERKSIISPDWKPLLKTRINQVTLLQQKTYYSKSTNLQSLHNTTRTIPAPNTQQNTQVMWCHVSLRSPNYIGQGGAQKPCERNEGGGCHKDIKTICPVGLGPQKYISVMWFC